MFVLYFMKKMCHPKAAKITCWLCAIFQSHSDKLGEETKRMQQKMPHHTIIVGNEWKHLHSASPFIGTRKSHSVMNDNCDCLRTLCWLITESCSSRHNANYLKMSGLFTVLQTLCKRWALAYIILVMRRWTGRLQFGLVWHKPTIWIKCFGVLMKLFF